MLLSVGGLYAVTQMASGIYPEVTFPRIAVVARVRKLYVTEGLEAALHRTAPDRVYRRKLDGDQEARLVAVACSAAPSGQQRWSLRLLADKLVELEVVAAVSYETVRQTLKQTFSNPG